MTARLSSRLRARLGALRSAVAPRRIDRPAESRSIDAPRFVAGEPIPPAHDWPLPAGRLFAFGAWVEPRRDVQGRVLWHVAPHDGVVWPRRRATRSIPMRDARRPGDVKLVWEPSRFLHLWDAVDEERAHRDQALRDLAFWLDETRLDRGVHWDNGLEAALRAISWIHADAVLAGRGDAAWAALRPRVLAALRTHARFIAGALDRGAYNHLVADAAGLVVIGASYPALDRGAGWRTLGAEILDGEISRQVLADGGHAERAPAYARFVADLYGVAGLALAGIDDERHRRYLQAAARLLRALASVADTRGEAPAFGDDDGACVLWTCRAEHRLGVSAAVLGAATDDATLLAFARTHPARERAQAVVARLLGPAKARALASPALPAAPVDDVRAPSVHLAATGIAVGRVAASWAALRCGPAGVGRGAHAHMDLLAVLADLDGAWSVIDPGTPTYGGPDALREASTATRAHATVAVDGRSQANRLGRFEWDALPSARVLEIRHDGTCWSLRAETGYALDGRPVLHRRTARLFRDRLEIDDDLGIEGEHEASMALLLCGRDRALGRWDEPTSSVVAPALPRLRVEVSGWSAIAAQVDTTSAVYGRAEPVLGLRLGARFRDRLTARITLAVLREPS